MTTTTTAAAAAAAAVSGRSICRRYMTVFCKERRWLLLNNDVSRSSWSRCRWTPQPLVHRPFVRAIARGQRRSQVPTLSLTALHDYLMYSEEDSVTHFTDRNSGNVTFDVTSKHCCFSSRFYARRHNAI